MIWFLLFIALVMLSASVWVNVITIKKNLELEDQRETLVDTIEESLDALDECYSRIMHNSQIDVLSDEPVIREVVADIKRARNVVLTIASKVVIYGNDQTSEGTSER